MGIVQRRFMTTVEVWCEEVEEGGALPDADVVVLVLWANIALSLFRVGCCSGCAASACSGSVSADLNSAFRGVT